MLSDERIDQLTMMRFEARKCALLVLAHESRISGNVSAQDRRQPSLNALFRHRSLLSGAQTTIRRMKRHLGGGLLASKSVPGQYGRVARVRHDLQIDQGSRPPRDYRPIS